MKFNAAAIQMQTRVGDVSHNLELTEKMVRKAAKSGARLIALPEFFTSAVTPDERPYAAVLGAHNKAVELLKRLASELDIWIGGSLLQEDHGEIYNRYVFAEPSHRLHTHDKDIPTMWENAFYVGGTDDGVMQCDLGVVGTAVCWELIREQTIQRMQGRVQVAMTGTHWWTVPSNWPGLGSKSLLLGTLARRNAQLSEDAPSEFAKRLGVPVLQASHCGQFSGRFKLLAGLETTLPYSTHFVGATQIVDANGSVLASRHTDQGPGIVHATINIQQPSLLDRHKNSRFWVPRLPWLIRRYWDQQNWATKPIYARKGRQLGLAAAKRNSLKLTQDNLDD